MRVSRLMLVTLRDDPAEAEIPSHKLLLRAGYIRRLSPGIYAYLPLLWRVLRKVSAIVREELDATGALGRCCPSSSLLSSGSAAAAGPATPPARGSCSTSRIARAGSWAWGPPTRR